MAASSSSIVEDWLRSVGMVQYTQAFLDNGYDDLEVCKQIGEDDLAAIGVAGSDHREELLAAVKVLREEGGAAVYFTLEECCDTCQSEDDDDASLEGSGLGQRHGSGRRSGGSGAAGLGERGGARSSGGSSGRPSGSNMSVQSPAMSSFGKGSTAGARSPRPAKPMSGSRKFSTGSSTAPSTPLARGGNVSGGSLGAASGASALMRMDAYELGKSALVTFPSVQLKLILRDKLVENNIDLSGPPYTNSEHQACGSSLTALAIRFAEELRTHFVDVMERLEELWLIARNNEQLYSQSLCGSSPTRVGYAPGGGSHSMHYGFTGHGQQQQQLFYPHHHHHHHHHHQQQQQQLQQQQQHGMSMHHVVTHNHPGSPRIQGQPPPLPSHPPPPTMSGNYMDRYPGVQPPHMDGSHMRADPFGQQTYVALDGGL